MEFWGVEVKSGESLTVSPEEGQLIHVSQVALGEVKNFKGAQYVPIRMKIDDKKYIIGSLSAESRPHLAFDLVFEKEFELSHDWKDGSVFFCGYTADNPDQEEFGPEDISDEDEEENPKLENGKVEPDVQVANPTKSKDASKKPVSATKPKVTLVDPKKEESDEEIDSDDSDEELNDDSDDSDLSGDSDDDMSEDEETPKKAEPTKKRTLESATKTPVPAKKTKSDTPQKTDGKKGSGHKATPHPSKQTVKKTAAVETPKSSGQVSCKSCSKTFNSEKGLESHSKAKHGGK